MPTSSHLGDLFGVGSSLRRAVPLVPCGRGDQGGWRDIWENAMFGGYLSAAADAAKGRVRVDLNWPGIRDATISRVHADGSVYAVRGGDPALVLTAWARFDYEAPLDQDISYIATSAQRPGLTATSAVVNLSSGGRHWLKSVAQPSLNTPVTIHDRGSRTAPPRAGKIEPPLRPDAIYVYNVRASDKGTIALYAADQATENAIRALLKPGGPLLLQYPAVAGGESLYLMVDAVGYNPAARITVDPKRIIALPFDTIGRPPGDAEGGDGNSYADVAGPFQTYGQWSASASTYLELSMASL